MGEEKFACPKCGALVSKSDRFCKNCGASLIEVSVSEVPSSIVPERKVEVPYERKFSLLQRFYKLVTSPSEAMEDIALAPDYEGVAVIIVVEAVLSILSLVLAFQKIQFVGTHAGTIMDFVSAALAFGSILGIGVIVVKWLIKSLIVKYVCDCESSWSFKTAASVTGYAYVASILVSIIGACIGWFLTPTFVIDTTNLQAAVQSMNEYRVEINWIILVYSLPVSLIGLIWKSYLGGLGAHFGTGERCSLGKGITVFFVLGLLSLLISFLGML